MKEILTWSTNNLNKVGLFIMDAGFPGMKKQLMNSLYFGILGPLIPYLLL